MSLTVRVFLGLIAGLAAGLAISALPALDGVVAWVEPIGTLWVNAIRMTVVPLVVALLIAGIAGTRSRAAGRIGGAALVLFATLIAFSSLFTALASPPLLAGIELDEAAVASLRESAAGAIAGAAELPPFSEWITELVPANAVRAAADGAILPLVVFTAIFAFALARLPAPSRDPVLRFFESVREAMLVVVGWILAVAPLGVFGLVLPIAARLGAQFAGALGYVVLVICGLLVISILALYPVAVIGGGVPLRRFAAACAPAQAVAFSTRSSLASLPPMIEEAERTLRLPPRVTGLVLPLAVSIFKFSSPIARTAETLFVATLYGIHMGPAEVALLAGAIGLLSFYSPGIPSGGLFVMAPVYVAFGLPVEGIGLLLALDLIPDMFITVSNVTADMTVAVVVARRVGADAATGTGPDDRTVVGADEATGTGPDDGRARS